MLSFMLNCQKKVTFVNWMTCKSENLVASNGGTQQKNQKNLAVIIWYWNRYHHLVISHCRCKLIRLKLGSFRATVTTRRKESCISFCFCCLHKQWCFYSCWKLEFFHLRSIPHATKEVRASLVSNCDWKKRWR